MVQSSLKENQKHAQIEPYNLSTPTILDCRGFIFIFYVQTTGTSRNTQQAPWTARSFTSINYEKIKLTSRNTQRTIWSSTHLITEKLLQFYNTYFFLFMYRLQAQAHSGPGSLLRASRKALFFFIYIQTTSTGATGARSVDLVRFLLTAHIIQDI